MSGPTPAEIVELIRAGSPAVLGYFGWRLWGDVRSFLNRIGGPAIDEVGALAADEVKAFRCGRLLRLLGAARDDLDREPAPETDRVNPRIMFQAFEYGSWVDDDVVSDMWGGLLASAVSPDGSDDSNLIFTDILQRMTSLQARILRYTCEVVPKRVDPSIGIVYPAGMVRLTLKELIPIVGIDDPHRIDRELDAMRAMELIHGGFDILGGGSADVTPSGLALNLFIRCHGSRLSPPEFFKLPADGSLITPEKDGVGPKGTTSPNPVSETGSDDTRAG